MATPDRAGVSGRQHRIGRCRRRRWTVRHLGGTRLVHGAAPGLVGSLSKSRLTVRYVRFGPHLLAHPMLEDRVARPGVGSSRSPPGSRRAAPPRCCGCTGRPASRRRSGRSGNRSPREPAMAPPARSRTCRKDHPGVREKWSTAASVPTRTSTPTAKPAQVWLTSCSAVATSPSAANHHALGRPAGPRGPGASSEPSAERDQRQYHHAGPDQLTEARHELLGAQVPLHDERRTQQVDHGGRRRCRPDSARDDAGAAGGSTRPRRWGR